MTLLYNPRNENLMSRTALYDLPVPAPLGNWHKPIPFGAFADNVAAAVIDKGFEILKEEYAVSKKNTRMFGLMTIAPLEGEFISAKEWEMQIGLRGSHDRSLPRGLTLGSNVLVCSNLCFHGDLGVFKTKQTLNVEERLPEVINNAIGMLPEMIEHNNRRFDAYRTTEFNKRDGDAALIELFRRGALSGRQLPRAIMEWDNPTFEAHAEDGFNVWRLFNACTEALKPRGGETANMNVLRMSSEAVTEAMDELVHI